MFSPSTKLTELWTVSVPSFAASLTVSPTFSTTKKSSPSPPDIASAPALPSSRLFPALPIRVLSSALPVPLTFAPPVSVRFSRCAPRVKVIALSTVSLPALAVSVTRSPARSTT